MFSNNIFITTSDFHAIFDISNFKRINNNKSVRICSNVWIASSCTILKGVTIGDFSVIGTGAIVTKNIPKNCIAAGIPARVVKSNIIWDRRNIDVYDNFL